MRVLIRLVCDHEDMNLIPSFSKLPAVNDNSSLLKIGDFEINDLILQSQNFSSSTSQGRTIELEFSK